MSVYSYDKLYASKIGNALYILLSILIMTIVVLKQETHRDRGGSFVLQIKRGAV